MIFIVVLGIALLNLWGFVSACKRIVTLDNVTYRGKVDLIGWNVFDLILTFGCIGFFIAGYIAAGFIFLAALVILFILLPSIMADIIARSTPKHS